MNAEDKNKPPLLGLRHLALRVSDMARARGFYEDLLGLKPVWEPDPGSVYLSSGSDNLALHLMSEEEKQSFQAGGIQSLDHLGFIVDSPETVRAMEKKMAGAGVKIVKSYKDHRDGSSSFYMNDPDENVVQILFEPHISPLRFSEPDSGGAGGA